MSLMSSSGGRRPLLLRQTTATTICFLVFISKLLISSLGARFQTVSQRDQAQVCILPTIPSLLRLPFSSIHTQPPLLGLLLISEQLIQLKSQYDLTPGKTLYLPIDVPKEPLGLFGGLTPRLQSIATLNSSGLYGPGDRLIITLTYTSIVKVIGTPTLSMNTGCFSSFCRVVEIQSFNCSADIGMFGLGIGSHYIQNIGVNTTTDQFKHLLEQLPGVYNVGIHFSESDERDYSAGNRICSSRGENVTVMFNNVSFPLTAGNVPNMQFDVTNSRPDPVNGLSLGEGNKGFPGEVNSGLAGVNPPYIPTITFRENQPGLSANPGLARYLQGSGTRTLLFEYIAINGEYATTLNVDHINYEPLVYAPQYHGYIYR